MGEREIVEEGGTQIQIEFGPAKIKATLRDENGNQLAVGDYRWVNHCMDGLWTDSLDEVWNGLQTAYAQLAADAMERYGVILQKTRGIEFSATKQGFLAFDKDGRLLRPFAEWRNTGTQEAARTLSETFGCGVLPAMGIVRLYQDILNEEEYLKELSFVTTLSGYIHWQMTGEKVLGHSEAQELFPVNEEEGGFDTGLILKFQELLESFPYQWKLKELLPELLPARSYAGMMTEEGLERLDISRRIAPGIPLQPPEKGEMKVVALGCDHGGYELMQKVKAHLDEQGIEYKDFGCDGPESVDYPDYAYPVGTAIQNGECEKGILICGTGIGISIAANKMHGIRAALCSEPVSAELTRLHNDANVLAMGGRIVAEELAFKIVDTFLSTEFSGDERHKQRLEKVRGLQDGSYVPEHAYTSDI